jgi:hypothetical protein
MKYIVVSVVVFCLTFSSCTKKYEQINTNPTRIAEITKTELPYLFAKATSSSLLEYYFYQAAQNLHADLYAQYYANVATYFRTDMFEVRMRSMNNAWIEIYTGCVPQLKTILTESDPNSTENALANIFWVYTFHRWTDLIGPIPYFKAGEALASVPYDAQDKIYDDFFKRLDAAEKILKANSTEMPFGKFDLIYGGHLAKWIKFSNTLRLRLALRISKVDPARAKIEAEAAVAAGVMTSSPGDDALHQRSVDEEYSNGLSVMTPWNEFRMSSAMESVLKGYNDPRISEYFSTTSGSGGTSYRGLRNGMTAVELTADPYHSKANTSIPGFRWNGQLNTNANATPQNVMCAAEAYFLRAEGALNGWNMGGTAKDLYEQGIRNSMIQWGYTTVSAQNIYISSSSTPAAIADTYGTPALSNIPVAFHPSDINVQREQIGTQKWLALYPDGFEAWAEYRRTRFPKLYPVLNSLNPDIPNGGVMRRIPFLDVEKTTNLQAVQSAVPLLNGPDNAATKLWWDKN